MGWNKDEIWKPVPGSNNVRVSNLGRVKKDRKICTPYPDKDGYLKIRMGKLGFVYIHRIVAELFVGNPDNKPIVDHIDGVKQNNRADNLRFVTIQENSQYAAELGLIPGVNRKGYLVCVDNETGCGKIFKSISEASRVIGTSPQVISQAVNGQKKFANGYRCFRVNDLQMAEEIDDDGIHYGCTLAGGNWYEMNVGDVGVRIADNRETPKKFAELKELCKDVINYVELKIYGDKNAED